MPKKIVLIVEDDEDFSDSLAEMLEDFTTEIRRAYTLESAEQQLQRPDDFCIIVWDYLLPDGTTGDLIKATRAKFGNKPMVAASSQPGTRRLQMQAGCNYELRMRQAQQLFKELLT